MPNARYSKLLAATVAYASFAAYLYQPYFKGFNALRLRDLFVINVCLASLGCYCLSRRWIGSFFASLFAGAIYGFGPFVLGLAKFHPSACTLAALIPWLFLPATYGPKAKWRWLRLPLCVLPFLVIPLFFEISAAYGLFPIPIQTKLHLADMAGLLAPLVAAKRNLTIVGFYHISIAALVMGFAMLLVARRFGVIIVFAAGAILAFCDPFFNVSPIIWLTIPVVCCSVLIGTGMEAISVTGRADRKWVLAGFVIMLILAAFTLVLAAKYFQIFAGLGTKYAKLLVLTAKMYLLSAIALGSIFFFARSNLRVRWLRIALLCSAMAVDIFISAQYIVDKVL